MTTGKGYWNAKDVEDYEDVMMQYFFIKTSEESREVFNMKKFFCVVIDLFERYIEEGPIIGVCRQE